MALKSQCREAAFVRNVLVSRIRQTRAIRVFLPGNQFKSASVLATIASYAPLSRRQRQVPSNARAHVFQTVTITCRLRVNAALGSESPGLRRGRRWRLMLQDCPSTESMVTTRGHCGTIVKRFVANLLWSLPRLCYGSRITNESSNSFSSGSVIKHPINL